MNTKKQKVSQNSYTCCHLQFKKSSSKSMQICTTFHPDWHKRGCQGLRLMAAQRSTSQLLSLAPGICKNELSTLVSSEQPILPDRFHAQICTWLCNVTNAELCTFGMSELAFGQNAQTQTYGHCTLNIEMVFWNPSTIRTPPKPVLGASYYRHLCSQSANKMDALDTLWDFSLIMCYTGINIHTNRQWHT